MTDQPADADLPARWIYGPTALVTPANALTMARLLAAPFLIAILAHSETSWPTWGVWTVLAGTDGIDGWLARRHGTTRSGAFLDPLADKFLVLGALYTLVAKGTFSWIPVTIIAVREVAISGYRIIAARHGVSVPARKLAKIKTLLQALAVGAVVWPVTGHTAAFGVVTLWLAVGLTIYTGGQYLLEARSKMTSVDVGTGAAGDEALGPVPSPTDD
ncbi:MAG: CDP-diacylglycerol--glycerol-3-phosphate 3-phosphatidyltransferase [Acidimicrobiales bacterium]